MLLHNAIIPSVVEKFRGQEPVASNSIVAAMGGFGGLMSFGTNLDDLVPLTRIR